MLTLTDEAVSVVRRLTEGPEVPDTAGVRISGDSERGGLGLTLAAEPLPGDEVVGTPDAHVFLDQEAATTLADQTLDAVVDGEGQVNFSLARQV
jgi:iron-sulfur cluster assembly protein